MTKGQKLFTGASRGAWGYFFLYLNVNFGTINMLPNFVGWMLFLSAIGHLEEERRDLALLRPLAQMLAVWNFIDWLFTCLGISLSGMLPIVELVMSLAGLYFHFQFITDCAALAADYQREGEELDSRLLRWRTWQTLMLTATTLMIYPAEWFGGWWEIVTVGMVVVSAVAALCLMMAMFALRRLFGAQDTL